MPNRRTRKSEKESLLGVSVQELYAQWAVSDEHVGAALDESLAPRGPDWLFDLAAELGIQPQHLVLDAGCRDGRHSVELVRRFGSRVVGVDLVRANLDRGRARIAGIANDEPDVAARVRFVQARVERLPFRDGTFDFVWCRDVLIHVAPLVDAFRECRRVLAEGGRMLVFQMFATPLLEPTEAARLWPPLAAVPESADPTHFERCLEEAGFVVERREVLGSEWREFAEEEGKGKTSRQLLHVARLLRAADTFRQRFGRQVYESELADSLWGVYQMIGKLSPRVYVLA